MRVIKLKEICQLLRISRTTFYILRAKDPTFPKPVFENTRSLSFDYNQVEQWYQSKLAKQKANKAY